MGSVYTTSREQFEQRMRLRRAATCLSAARSAAASGRMAEAVARLEEACALDPGSAEARVLLEELQVQATTVPPAIEVRRVEGAGWSHWLAAGVAICALAALAFLWPSNRGSTGRGLPPTGASPMATGGDAPSAVHVEPPPYDFSADTARPVATVGTVVGAGSGDAPSGTHGTPSGVRVSERPVVIRAAPEVAPPSGDTESVPGNATPVRTARGDVPSPDRVATAEPASIPAVAASSRPETGAALSSRLPPLERVPLQVEDSSRLVPAEAVANVPLTPSPRADAAEASTRAELAETGAVEATLRRYAEAYERLDAAAARAVWPSVDERALARAFDGLESQGLTFDRCEVSVAGAMASAACSGRARYVPKVGSRDPLVEQRRWTFHLRKVESGWQIAETEVK
jgi:hypothetical protein